MGFWMLLLGGLLLTAIYGSLSGRANEMVLLVMMFEIWFFKWALPRLHGFVTWQRDVRQIPPSVQRAGEAMLRSLSTGDPIAQCRAEVVFREPVLGAGRNPQEEADAQARRPRVRVTKNRFAVMAAQAALVEYGTMTDTPAARSAVSKFVRDWAKARDARDIDIVRMFPIAVGLYFVPTAADVEERQLLNCTAYMQRRAAMQAEYIPEGTLRRFAYFCAKKDGVETPDRQARPGFVARGPQA